MSSRALLAVALWAGAAMPLGAQATRASEALPTPLFVNDEMERYLRVRQIVGDAPLQPWSIREFTFTQAAAFDSARGGPWADATPRRVARGPLHATALPLVGAATFNSAFPYGMNDGPVWQGRGLTTQFTGGLAAAAGPLHATFAPVLFRAENKAFPLRPNGEGGVYVFGDAFDPYAIDQPQRFGTRPYQRFDWGNSSLSVESRGFVAGVSHATQHWGPARDHPLILGNNASGFAHAFVGTARPLDLWIAKVHARMFWGRLDSSPYSIAYAADRYRLADGLVALVEPRGVPGLELGFGRFFHIQWSDSVLRVDNLLRPFIGVVRKFRIRPSGNAIGDELDNQLASVFGRWVHPSSGVEVYGEFAREDYNQDFRDLALEPDHMGGYLLGVQRALRRADSGYTVIRAEVMNTRIGPLITSREQSRFYEHTRIPQGHTNDGQVLGSIGAFGGGAAVLAVDRYTRAGRISFSWSRVMRAEYRDPATQVPDPGRADVFHELGVDGVTFRGRLGVTWEAAGVYEMDRNFQRDAFNARLGAGLRYAW